MSDEQNFDPRKFGDEVRESARKLSQDLHEKIHREINDRVLGARKPLVIGVAIRGRGRGGMITGALFILVGLVFLLDHLGLIYIGNPWRFWPLLVILAGVLNFASRRRAWGTFLVLTGILLQHNTL